MTLQQRKEELIQQISEVEDEEVLVLIGEELSLYKKEGTDIFDCLSEDQLEDLRALAAEPESETVSKEEYIKATAKWRTK